MGVTSIESCGTYVPRYRIEATEFEQSRGGFEARGVSEKAVAASDEDAVTMAADAVDAALVTSQYTADDIQALSLGTTTPPIDEGDIGAQVAEMTGLPRSVELAVHTQSTRAGTRAVTTAAESAAGPTIAVAADCPIAAPDSPLDHAAGAGAVAFVLAEDGAVAIEETASYTRDYPGTRFRERGRDTVDSLDVTAYERDAYTSTIAGACSQLERPPAALAPTAPDGRLPHRAGRAMETDVTVYELASTLGDTGAASPLFGLIAAWNNDDTDVVVAGYGAGAAVDVIRLSGSLAVDWERETTALTYSEYLRKRGHLTAAHGGKH